MGFLARKASDSGVGMVCSIVFSKRVRGEDEGEGSIAGAIEVKLRC